jgi:hypothetical protein
VLYQVISLDRSQLYAIATLINIFTKYPKHTSATVDCSPNSYSRPVGIPKYPLVWWEGKSIEFFFPQRKDHHLKVRVKAPQNTAIFRKTAAK